MEFNRIKKKVGELANIIAKDLIAGNDKNYLYYVERLKMMNVDPLTYGEFLELKMYIGRCFDMIDGYGVIIHYPHSGGLFEQDTLQIEILRIVARHIRTMGSKK